MSTRVFLMTALLFSAGPACAECVYKEVFNYVTGENETVPFSCPPAKARQAPKFQSWQDCPVREERNESTGKVQRVRSCA
jgi:hypothetical protein